MKNPPMQALEDAALEAIALVRDEVEGLFVRSGPTTPDVTPTLKMLFWYLSSRGQAVLFLLTHGYAWDAEIVLRSFYDTAAKILLVALADDSEKAGLIEEFWSKLGAIHQRKLARRAGLAERTVEQDEGLSGPILRALQDPRLFPTEDETTQAERKRLEHKWSFTGMIEYLGGKSTRLKGITSLLHMYGMASHLAHADSVAMDLMADRSRREMQERGLLEASHASRIILDEVSLWWLCADALRQHYKAEFTDGKQLIDTVRRTIELATRFGDAFEASQREFYETHGYRAG